MATTAANVDLEFIFEMMCERDESVVWDCNLVGALNGILKLVIEEFYGIIFRLDQTEIISNESMAVLIGRYNTKSSDWLRNVTEHLGNRRRQAAFAAAAEATARTFTNFLNWFHASDAFIHEFLRRG